MSNNDWNVLLQDTDELASCANPDLIFLGSFTYTVGISNLPGLFKVDGDIISSSWSVLRLRKLAGFQGSRVSLLGGVGPI